MAREEGYSEGVIPMNTIRSDLDYAIEEAHTTYGQIGVKVWINRGENFDPSNSTSKNLNKKRPYDPNQRKRSRRFAINNNTNVLRLPKDDSNSKQSVTKGEDK